jgi:hypothetical protein
MLEVLDETKGLVNTAGVGSFSPSASYPFETPYESKFRAVGKKIHYLEYRKRIP